MFLNLTSFSVFLCIKTKRIKTDECANHEFYHFTGFSVSLSLGILYLIPFTEFCSKKQGHASEALLWQDQDKLGEYNGL